MLADQLFLDGSFSVGAEYIYSNPVDAVAVANFDIEDISLFPTTVSQIRYYGNDPVAIPFIEPKSNQSFSVFSELNYQLTDRLNSITSLRYDYASNIDEGELLPRVALVYRINAEQYFKYIHSQAFRNPGAIELHATNNNTLLGDEDLTSEIVRSNEVVWTYQVASMFTNLSVYENEIENAIEQTIMGGKRIFLNQDNEVNRGMEIEMRLEPLPAFQLHFTYQYMEKMLDSAFRLSDKSGSIIALWEGGPWNVGFNSYYHSKSQSYINTALDLVTLPSYWHHSIKLSYDVDADVSASMHVGNVLNRTIYTPTISTILPEGLPSLGRQIIMTFGSKI